MKNSIFNKRTLFWGAIYILVSSLGCSSGVSSSDPSSQQSSTALTPPDTGTPSGASTPPDTGTPPGASTPSGTSVVTQECNSTTPTVFYTAPFQYTISELNGTKYFYCNSHTLAVSKFHLITILNDADIYKISVAPIGYLAPAPNCGAMPGYSFNSHKAVGLGCTSNSSPGPAGEMLSFQMKNGSVHEIKIEFSFF